MSPAMSPMPARTVIRSFEIRPGAGGRLPILPTKNGGARKTSGRSAQFTRGDQTVDVVAVHIGDNGGDLDDSGLHSKRPVLRCRRCSKAEGWSEAASATTVWG